jgi:hypothetical protein
MFLASGARDARPEVIEKLDQAYIRTRTKDIEDATSRTMWFHMETSRSWYVGVVDPELRKQSRG